MQSKGFRALKWVVVNGAMAAAVWFGVGQGVTGAQNVVLFMTWLLFTLGLFAQAGKVVEASAETMAQPAVPVWLDVLYDAAVIGFLIWHAWWFTGVAYLMHAIFMATLRKKCEDFLKSKATATA